MDSTVAVPTTVSENSARAAMSTASVGDDRELGDRVALRLPRRRSRRRASRRTARRTIRPAWSRRRQWRSRATSCRDRIGGCGGRTCACQFASEPGHGVEDRQHRAAIRELNEADVDNHVLLRLLPPPPVQDATSIAHARAVTAVTALARQRRGRWSMVSSVPEAGAGEVQPTPS